MVRPPRLARTSFPALPPLSYPAYRRILRVCQEKLSGFRERREAQQALNLYISEGSWRMKLLLCGTILGFNGSRGDGEVLCLLNID